MYAAQGLSYGDTDFDDDEFLTIEKTPIDTLINDILEGKLKDAKTQTAILKTKLLLDKGELWFITS